MRTICRTLALHPQIWGHRIEPFALPAELQAHFYELFEGEPRGSRMRYNTIAKTVPLALPAELQAHLISVVNGPENIDIIAMFGAFVKAFFLPPRRICSARGRLVFTRPACCGG